MLGLYTFYSNQHQHLFIYQDTSDRLDAWRFLMKIIFQGFSSSLLIMPLSAEFSRRAYLFIARDYYVMQFLTRFFFIEKFLPNSATTTVGFT